MQTPTFGQWLKARRKALDVTRAQLANQIGCAEITLGKIERDQRRPSKQIAELLASALRIPAEAREPFVQFARGSGEPPVMDGNNPPTQASTSRPLTNLPAPLTSFIDRTNELAAVQQRLLQPDVRLLTLVGPPGIGKTRLSIQVGQAVRDQFVDGVWFVALAPINDPMLVLPAIAHTFDIADAGATPLVARLQDHLRLMQVLLVLDNFEQVLEAAPYISDLLKACPKVKAIATSRELLRVYGEHGYPMPALSLPPRNKTQTVEQLAQFDAIKLFVARAEAVQPGFALTADNAQAVGAICLRLDGVPLAIELATAQLRHFTLPKLHDALNEAPLQSLTSSVRDMEPRQRTLRNSIQWSYDLLSVAERAAFNRLGVFVGGCTSASALAVCELADDTLLHALADRNLLKYDANERWTMLEMIHEFALDALAQSSGDKLEQTRRRHAEYFARILKQGSDETYPYHLIDVEQHNARAALHWLLDHKHPLTFELTQFMSWYFHLAGLTSENRRMLHAVVSSGIELTPVMHYRLLSGATIVANQQHDFEAALRYTQEALAIAQAMNSQTLIADALIDHGMVYIEMGDYAQVKKVALEAVRIGRSIHDPVQIVGALNHLGKAALAEGDMSHASACYEEAYTLCQTPEWRQPIYASQAYKGMGELALSRGDYTAALQFLRDGLEISNPPVIKLWILDVLAGVIGTMPRRTTADVCRAAQIWGTAEALHEKSGLNHAPDDRRRTDALIASARTRISPKAFAAALAEGRELSLDEAIALAMMD